MFERFFLIQKWKWFNKSWLFWGYQSFSPIPWEFDFENFPIFLNAWAAPICVGVLVWELLYLFILLCWSFLYMKGVILWWILIRFCSNSRNFNPRKILFLISFQVQCHGHQNMWNFLTHLLIHMRSFQGCSPTKTPTQKLKSGFRVG